MTAYSQSDLFGKSIILGLLALSVVCWVLLIYKTWMLRQVKRVSFSFHSSLEKNKERLLSLDLAELPRHLRKDLPHPYAQIFSALKGKTLEILDKNRFFLAQSREKSKDNVYLSPNDIELVESYALTTISSQAKKLESNIFILSTIMTLAPFLGLLGTVWGILVSFAGLQGGASAGSNSAILGGLSTALSTTVLGLIIAIPALVSYNYLKNTLRNFSSDMEDFLYLLLSTVELQYRKVEL